MTFLVVLYCTSHQLAATNPGVINEDCSNLEAGESICLSFVNENCPTTHTVKAGDTCLKITSENGLSMNVLRTNNPQLNQSCDIHDGEVRVFFFKLFSRPVNFFWVFILCCGLRPLDSLADPKY